MLANPSADMQEAPEVSREQLRERGIRPYNEKVPTGSQMHNYRPSQQMCTIYTGLTLLGLPASGRSCFD